MENITLLNGDCLEILSTIQDKSVDFICTDLPYGTTKNEWDTEINLDLLWKEYRRIIKDKGCIALFGQQPFTSKLVMSNLEMFKYEWIWEKPMATGVLNCNFAPMKAHEEILIFSKSAACFVKDKDNAMVYNPQKTVGKPYKCTNGRASSNYDLKHWSPQTTINNGDRQPRDIITFQHDTSKFHPTQKPIALLEYLIKTYSNENDTVLDSCMGSGSLGVACKNTHRNFIGIEKDTTFYNIAVDRINNNVIVPIEDNNKVCSLWEF